MVDGSEYITKNSFQKERERGRISGGRGEDQAWEKLKRVYWKERTCGG